MTLKPPRTPGDFAPTHISSRAYKVQALLLPNHSAVVTPRKSNRNGVMSPNARPPSFPVPSTFLFSLITSRRVRALTPVPPHSPRGNRVLRPSPPGPSSSGCLYLVPPRCQAGDRVAGEPRGQREQGPNPLPLPPAHARPGLASRSGRHCQALWELLRGQHCGATDMETQQGHGSWGLPFRIQQPIGIGGIHKPETGHRDGRAQ